MYDFVAMRNELVKVIRREGISDERVLAVIGRVPRESFIAEEMHSQAYGNYPLPIGEGQTISQPYIVAMMTELLCLQGNEKLLEIGTGSGYQSAILAELAAEVYTVENHLLLSQRAQATIRELGYGNIRFLIGDGSLGWEEHAPYDAIIVTAAAPELPSALLEQLVDGGRLVIPVGGVFFQDLVRVVREGDTYKQEYIESVRFVPLIGAQGWKE